MMTALIAATVCSIALACVPTAARVYVYARVDKNRRRHR